ncbi:MAG: alpha-galactosidase [Lachnospiraceae bacterium]|nr:alpha-galactosidase [Lachnospiraceae bacterium]
MSICFDPNEKIFYLNTPNTSYVMGIYCGKLLLHLYYGKKIDRFVNFIDYLPVAVDLPFSPIDIEETNASSNLLPMEYPCYGNVDFRTPAFHAEYENGSTLTRFEYVGHEIAKGKKKLNGLPATYVDEDNEADTLYITLRDELTGIEAILSYTAYNKIDAIAKSVKIQNAGNQNISIKSVLSSTTYLFDKEFEFVHLEGSWARERNIQKKSLMNGIMQIDSKRVSSSHTHSPFLALARPWATEIQGEVYGFSLVYSGNHIEQVEVSEYDVARINVGINPFGFNWILAPKEEFQAPEVVLTYSNEGFGKMSRTYHELYRSRLCRGKYRDIERPVLINNWEATYFDFNEEKILNIAKKAKDVGVELMVLDDGWFGKRNSDNCSLGDWVADRNKLPNGIESLATKITELGMKFGLWFEPEMISEDSELYRIHPDWCIHVEGRKRNPARNQLVLDLSRKDVRDYIVDSVSNILKAAPISYVKWDYNRNISDIGSEGLPVERQQELPHRYVLGIYEILERITTAFPDVLFEGCSGGGGRFDAGMIHYYPQYWTSDNSDAIERLYIQHGTSMVMPVSTMGAHVSAIPNHQVGRSTPLKMRGNVAMSGQFGYELDLNTLDDDELELVKQQITDYKKIREVIHHGNMYRLKSPFEGRNTVWEYIYKDKVVLMYFTMFTRSQLGKIQVKLQGLEDSVQYVETLSGRTYSGSYLMNVGLYFDNNKEFNSEILVFEKKQ